MATIEPDVLPDHTDVICSTSLMTCLCSTAALVAEVGYATRTQLRLLVDVITRNGSSTTLANNDGYDNV